MPTKFITQEERIANLSTKNKVELEDLTTEEGYLDPDSYSYPHEDDAILIDWETYEQTLNKEEVTQLIIEPNKYRFGDDNKLVLKDYPKLKYLYAGSCGLEDIEIINTPSLETINLNDNQLTEIDLTQLVSEGEIPPLKSLVISNNQLEQLNVWFLENLETLWCFNNCLRELDCSYLEKLEDLNCSANGTTKRMSCLNVDGCSNLKQLDCDCNDLESLDFSHLISLEGISVRQNNHNTLKTLGNFFGADLTSYLASFTKYLTINSPYIKFVDYKFSDAKKCFFLTKTDNLVNVIDSEVDEGYCSDDEFAEKHEDSPTVWEQHAYQRQQAQLKKDFIEGKFTYQGQQHLDLSNCSFIKSITIDGEVNYPKSLVSINLGGNYLSEVIVRNLPNLRRLIISHNCIKNLIIENCPNLDQSQFYSYKSGDRDEPIPTQGRVYDDKRDNPIQQEEARKKAEQERLLEQVISCLAQAEEALARQDYQALAKLIEQLKELTQEPIAGISPAKLQTQLNKYEQSLLAGQAESVSVPPVKLLIGLGIISLLALGIIIHLINKQRKVKQVLSSKTG